MSERATPVTGEGQAALRERPTSTTGDGDAARPTSTTGDGDAALRERPTSTTRDRDAALRERATSTTGDRDAALRERATSTNGDGDAALRERATPVTGDRDAALRGRATTRRLRALRGFAAALSILWIVALAVAFALRASFPLELEWMEGGSVHQALRVQQGLPVYAPPSAEFIPFLYTPLYPALLALLGAVFPLGLALGRVVSVAAFAAACAGAWWIVGREGKPRAHQLAAVGLMCAGFVFTYRFYDVARADTLMLALIVWGLGLWRHADARPGRAALAGLLLALAFWTKQTAALFILAAGVAGLYLVFRAARRRRALLALATLVLVIAAIDGGGALVGARATGGWLWNYIYELHQTHAFNHERFTEKSWGMLLHAAPLVVALLALRGGAALTSVARAARARRWPVAADGAVFWGIIAAAALLASALGYSTQWAEANAFMPAVWFGAVFVAVLLPVGRGEPLALALVGLQLGFSLLVEPRYQPIQRDGARAGLSESYAWQDPWRTIPTPAQRRRAASLRAELSAGPPVFALHHPMWPLLAGGDGHVGAMGIHDVPPEHRARVEAAVREQLDRVAYPVLWFEGPPPAWLRGVVRRRYRLERRVRGDDRVRPMTGFMSDAGMVTPYRREQLRYVPRS